MALDLTLKYFPKQVENIISKADNNIHYAEELDKFGEIDIIEQHIKMAKVNFETESIFALKELLNDSISIPNFDCSKNKFFSKTRGYQTLNYLLISYLSKRKNIIIPYTKTVFFSGKIINSELQYLSSDEVIQIHELIKPIVFEDLLEFYNYEKLKGKIYKLTQPENLHYLKNEFYELQLFWYNAYMANSFIIVKIS